MEESVVAEKASNPPPPAAEKIEDPDPNNPQHYSEESFSDVTEGMSGWLTDLKHGQTLLDTGFSMEEAMHAWEVLSVKMDSGTGYKDVKTLTEVQKDGSLPDGSSFTSEEAVGVMDKILGMELVLYRGYHMVHSAGTCYYLQDYKYVKNALLQLYCRCTVKCIQQVFDIVRTAEISFEEEMIRISGDFSLDCGGTRATLLKELNETEQVLAKQAKDGDTWAAIIRSRLVLRRGMLELFDAALEKASAHPSLLKEKIAAVGSALNKLQGKVQPEMCPKGIVEEQMVRRELGAAVPARAIPWLSGEEIVSSLKGLLEDLSIIGTLPSGSASIEDFVLFLGLFATRSPSIISRAVARRWLYFEGKLLGGQAPVSVMESFFLHCKVPASYLSNELSVKNGFIPFLTQQAGVLFVSLCTNPARQRRRLRSTVHYEVPQITPAAYELEMMVTKPIEQRKFFRFFSAYQILLNCLLILQHLRLGSLLRLYETDELCQIYWYMSYVHREMDTWKTEVDSVNVKEKDKKKANAKGKQQKGSAVAAAKKVKIINHHDMTRAAENGICKGIYYTMLLLKKKNVFVPPSYEMQPGHMRWNKRFAFMSDERLRPNYMSFEKFNQRVVEDGALPAETLLSHALESYKVTKQKVEACMKSRGEHASSFEIDFLKSLTKVAVVNTLHLQTLKADADTVVVEWTVNPFYPTIATAKKK